MPLNDKSILNAKPKDKAYRLSDGSALYIEIRPTGKKVWLYRYKIAGKGEIFTIGEFIDNARNRPYPNHISLVDARIKRDEAKQLVKQGIHPLHHKQTALKVQIAENANTFKVIAEEWKEATETEKVWSTYYSKQVTHILETDIFPSIGKIPIRNITSAQILEIISSIKKRGAFTVALLARQICSTIFDYAISHLKAESNPVSALKNTIKRPPVQHHKPLPQNEIPIFLKKLDEYGCNRPTFIAIRLMLLTFVRTKELRMATWDEFDFDNAEWRIPANRMKMKQPHIIPLSEQAYELLIRLKSLTGHQKWLFPNVRRPLDCMTNTTLNRVIERIGYGGKFSAHGFRGTASTILNEKGYPSDYIEKQLAHAPKDQVRASYNHAQHLSQRKAMLQDWADFIDDLCEKAFTNFINSQAT